MDMKEDEKYNNLETIQQMDQLTSWMASMSRDERSSLAAMGMMRMSRKQALEYLSTGTNTEYIYTMFVTHKTAAQEDSLGYAFFEQVDRKDLGRLLQRITTNDELKWLEERKRGMVAECILAMGSIYQMEHCPELEGIMDLVVCMENKTRFKSMEDTRVEKDMEDAPATHNDLHFAVNTLATKVDRLMMITETQMEKARPSTEEAKEICKQLLEEAKATKETERLMNEAKENKNQQDKALKKAAEELIQTEESDKEIER